MKKEVEIKITLNDDRVTIDGTNLNELKGDDLIDSIKLLIILGMTLNIIQDGDFTNGNA